MRSTLLVPLLVSTVVIADRVAAKFQSRGTKLDAGWHEAFDIVVSWQVAALRNLVSKRADKSQNAPVDGRAPHSSAA
jgi:hypothetical protein